MEFAYSGGQVKERITTAQQKQLEASKLPVQAAMETLFWKMLTARINNHLPSTNAELHVRTGTYSVYCTEQIWW